MMNPEMAVVPPGGGYRFLQKLPNGGNRPFLANSPKKLYEEVLEFRRNNNLPTENLEAELKAGASYPVVTAMPQGRSLRERVTAWLLGRQFGVVKYVNPEIAEARAKLASQSPCNITQFTDSCSECYSHTMRGLYSIRQGRSTKYDDQLGACEVCGWHIPTVVHLDDSCLSVGKELGHICWNENTED